MSAAIAWTATTDAQGRAALAGVDEAGREFRIERHGAGRSHWETRTPEGLIAALSTTQDAAKQRAAGWATLNPAASILDDLDDWDDERSAPSGETVLPSTSGQENLTGDQVPPSAWTDAQLVEHLVALGLALDGDTQAPRTGAYGYSSAGDAQQAALKAARGLARLRKAVEAAIAEQVETSRRNTSSSSWSTNAATWDLVGAALGVSKQSASTRYGVSKT